MRCLTLLHEPLMQSHESLKAQSQHGEGRQRTRRENTRKASTKRDAPNSFTSSCLNHSDFLRETTTGCLHETLLHFCFSKLSTPLALGSTNPWAVSNQNYNYNYNRWVRVWVCGCGCVPVWVSAWARVCVCVGVSRCGCGRVRVWL